MSTAALSLASQDPHRIRVVTAASLFDGHDAAINIMRRILQSTGAEVIHLGHNRSVQDVVYAALQEDAHAVAISSYQGGHMEYFRYLRTELVKAGAGHIKIFGGGGGTIIPEEKRALEADGITRIYHPEDGRRLGLQGMINEMISLADHCLADIEPLTGPLEVSGPDDWRTIARAITLAEAAIEGEVATPRWDEVAKG